MSFAPGPYVICAHPDCESTALTTVWESWDAIDHVFVGEQQCDACHARMIYSRRPSTPQEIAMTRKKKPTRKPQSHTKSRPRRARPAAHRVNTIKANGALPSSQEIAPGDVPVGEAMRLAVEALGDVVIDDKLAPAQMRQLADALEQVEREKAAFNAKAEAAKIAKKSLESATNLLLEKVRSFTHPAPLPLFDQSQAEDDEDDMLSGGDVAEAHA